MTLTVNDTLADLEGENLDRGIKQARELLSNGQLTQDETRKLIYGLGAAHFQQENYQQAKKWLTRSDDDRSYFLLGFAERGLENHQQAAEAFQQAAGAQPDRKNEANFLRAQSLWLDEQFELAESIYDELTTEVEDPSFRAEILLDRAFRIRNRDGDEAALPMLRELFEDYEETSSGNWAGVFLARWHQTEGQSEKALEIANLVRDRAEDPTLVEQVKNLISELQEIKQHQESNLSNYEY